MKIKTVKTLFSIVLFFSVIQLTSAAVVNPNDMRGLRNETILLNFGAVKSGTEDRTVVHFDISGLSGVTSATLNIGINNIDPNDPAGSFDVYSFAGDGFVSTDEWSIGTLSNSFTGIGGGVQTLTMDVSTLLGTALLSGDNYLGFNFLTTDTDRYWLNHTIDGITGAISGEGPTFLSVNSVPVPAAAWLFGSGLIGLFTMARRNSKP